MRCAVLFGLGLVVSVAQAHAQTSSESMGVSETGEIVSIDTKTIRTVKYPKMSPGDPQMASYREAWTRVTKEGKLIGQFLWLFDCQGNFVEMASPTSDITARAKLLGVESMLMRIPPDSFQEVAQSKVCKK